jgi:hypothetical protein
LDESAGERHGSAIRWRWLPESGRGGQREAAQWSVAQVGRVVIDDGFDGYMAQGERLASPLSWIEGRDGLISSAEWQDWKVLTKADPSYTVYSY